MFIIFSNIIFVSPDQKKGLVEIAEKIVKDESELSKQKRDILKLGKNQPNLVKWGVGHLNSQQIRENIRSQKFASSNSDRRLHNRFKHLTEMKQELSKSRHMLGEYIGNSAIVLNQSVNFEFCSI